ncbi:hypothetical protein G9A89_000879 [Geosiphon pyriformis]|nr:hypothetical protein G9A89_000879 [Geosiphon pyriformis]
MNLQPTDIYNIQKKRPKTSETSNKDKQKVKQYSRTTPNIPILLKTTAKHLQTPEQGTSVKLPLSITLFSISLENESNHSESLESEETKSEPEEITGNEEKMATAYIAKIPEFTSEDNDTSPQEWLNKVQKTGDANGTAKEWFENLEELFENWQVFKDAVMGWSNKLMDSKREQDCRVMEIIKGDSTSMSELNEYGFNVQDQSHKIS